MGFGHWDIDAPAKGKQKKPLDGDQGGPPSKGFTAQGYTIVPAIHFREKLYHGVIKKSSAKDLALPTSRGW
jgi:hypothetical protein